MCWRGHNRIDKNGGCLECHRRRMWYYRTGRKPPRQPKYFLNLDLFRKLSYRRMNIVAELAGSNYGTLQDWVYGHAHDGRRSAATRDNAQALADALRVPFERLWSRTD